MIKRIGLLFFILLSLISCYSRFKIPETVIIDGILYRNGFYSDLYPINFTYGNQYYEVDGNKFRRANHETFDLVKFSNDGTVLDVLYCAESQWEQAYNYYVNRDNFNYYCRVGRLRIDRDPMIITIHGVDHNKFDELLSFADENAFNPFRRNNVNTIRLPFPDDNETPELSFYFESKDGYFSSTKAYNYYIINEQLFLLYYYDYGHGEYEEIVLVPVPDDLGQYFVQVYLHSIVGNAIPG